MALVSDRYIMNDERFTHAKVAIEKSYQGVIDSLSDKSMLPYDPIIYPIPFILSRKYKRGRELARALFYSLSYPDVSDFTKFSIYIVVSIFEKFPDHLVGLIGHEIAHIIAAKGEVKLSEEDLSRLLKSWPEFIEDKERMASRVYLYFREPTRSMIEGWNQIALQSETECAVAQGMQLVDKEQFDRLVFGERIADFERFIEVNLDRIRGTRSSSKVSG
ncbi:MAG: hypothetical protein M3299_08450 [Thermoproteota archaeon]|nr:hypothetical protein [Thermoproteota archaeon]